MSTSLRIKQHSLIRQLADRIENIWQTHGAISAAIVDLSPVNPRSI